jgi:hypothetical protein
MKNPYKGHLSFEYNLNHKNWGFIDDDEPFEHFYEGNITTLFSPDYPKTIGVFELVVYELDKAKRFNQLDTLIETISDLSNDHTSRFTNINKVINDHYLDFKSADKVIYLKNVIIHPDYRGKPNPAKSSKVVTNQQSPDLDYSKLTVDELVTLKELVIKCAA